MGSKKITQEQAHELLMEIGAKGEGLTPWEVGFVADLIDKGWRHLTDKQIETIQRIHDQRV